MTAKNTGAKPPLVIDGQTGMADPHPPPIDLAKAIDVRREMARVYRGMRSKEVDPSDGTKFIYALTAIGKMIELEEIEQRLNELESRTNGKLPAPYQSETRPH